MLAIVVHFGSIDLTRAAVKSVLLSNGPAPEIVVVDNDPSPIEAPPEWREVNVLRSGANLGFAAGVNYAASHALHDGVGYLWLLNNDAVAAPDALSELLAVSQAHGDGALVSSLVRDPDSGGIWFERAVFYPWRLESWHQPGDGSDVIDPGRPSWRSVPYLPGCSLLIPRRVWDSVGRFDESYFVYGEDVDYCTRARSAGFQLVVARQSVVVHRSTPATPEPARESMKTEAASRLIFRMYPWLLPISVAWGVSAAIRRDRRWHTNWLLRARLAGIRAFLRHRTHGVAPRLTVPTDRSDS